MVLTHTAALYSEPGCCTHKRGHAPPPYPSLCPNISLTAHLFSEVHIFVSMQPSSTGSQHSIRLLGFSPIHHMHGYQLHCLHRHLILEMHMLTQQLFISLSLTSICRSHNGTFQQGPNYLMVVVNGDLVQNIGHPVICPLLILQSKFKGGQHAYPPVLHGIKVGSCKDVC